MSKLSSTKFNLTNLFSYGFVMALAGLLVFGAGVFSGQAQTIIYDNGGLATGATTQSGVAAPAGTQWSEVANDTGNTTFANTNAGASCSVTTATVFRCADNFTVPAGATWTINNVIVFAYQTGATGTTSPITAGTLQIWNGRPGDAGATVVFGNTTTNRLTASTDSLLFRIFNTVAPSPGTAPGTTRKIWRNTLAVSPGLVLTAGTYWIDWNTTVGANAAHFAPSVTVAGARTQPGWNARQFTGAAWVDFIDVGNPDAAAPDVAQDFPFKLEGTTSQPPTTTRTRFDYDGDGKADVSVFRPSNGTWYLQQSQAGFTGTVFGASDDLIVPADYDGDGKTDIAVLRPSSGVWYLQRSQLGFTGISFGTSGDIPMPADYDGDGKADLAVFRPSNGTWYIQQSMNGFTGVVFGTSGDVPVAADYDGDGKADVAVFRPSNGTWYLNRSQAGFTGVVFGTSGDKAVPADYDGDSKADVAVFRPSNGTWYLQQSTAGFTGVLFGTSGDLPVPANYDGDGKADVAVFRPSNGTWYLQQSTAGFTGTVFGASTDKPTPNAFVP